MRTLAFEVRRKLTVAELLSARAVVDVITTRADRMTNDLAITIVDQHPTLDGEEDTLP